MRHRLRIQPYVSPEARRKLSAFSLAQNLTESAVVDAAVLAYCDRTGVDESLVVRRLDGVGQGIGKVQDDLQALTWAFARFVRYAFLIGPAESPPVEASKRMEALYGQFLVTVGRELRSGVTFAGVVKRELAKANGPAPARPDKGQ